MCTIKQHDDEEYDMGKYLWDKYMLEYTGYNGNLKKKLWNTCIHTNMQKV